MEERSKDNSTMICLELEKLEYVLNGNNDLNILFKEQIAFYNNLIENCAVAIFVIDSTHRVIYWNKACEMLTGIKSKNIIGTQNHWMPFYDYQRPTIADLIIDQATDKCSECYTVFSPSILLPHGWHAEGWYMNLGRKDRYIIFDSAPIYNQQGDIVAAIETIQDITERMLLEKERKQLTIELRKAYDEINQLKKLINSKKMEPV
ncbi:MAG: PAS domain S-box protein [Desulfobacterales bacterium]|nr:PAS domain S-box protein [Desulfobacterales bacterium]